ncbi:helix-turn-helix domain-containing protein [Levilactobacillus lanxiensis]|jgi:transcriptional regulator with XRE-family HTH domain|uniref:Helix-turn-helix domain-containing protein n=1 Tax=Levilactobacillus lanxiensis TaxID=2799568 RepID=A0ABW4CZP5_9LACO|nr:MULTISPECIES: helix-turn-helix transcriptional regulator [Levilactobacillus]
MSKTLPERITDLREAKGITQGQLATELNLDKSSMSRIEKGTRKISTEEFLKIVDFFKIPADYALGRTDDMTEPKFIKDDLTTIKVDDLPYYYRAAIDGYAKFQRARYQERLKDGKFDPTNPSE